MRTVFLSALGAIALMASAADVTPPKAVHGTSVQPPAGPKGTGVGGTQLTGSNRNGKDIVPSATAQKGQQRGHEVKDDTRQGAPNGK